MTRFIKDSREVIIEERGRKHRGGRLLAQAKEGVKHIATHSGNITDARKSLGGRWGSKPGEPATRAGVDGADCDSWKTEGGCSKDDSGVNDTWSRLASDFFLQNERWGVSCGAPKQRAKERRNEERTGR